VQLDLSLLQTGPYAWLEQRVELAPGSEPAVDYVQPDHPARNPGAYAQRSVGAVVDIAGSEGSRSGHLVLFGGIVLNNAGFRVGGNGDLGLNIMQWLAERKVLVQVRGERYQSRRLDLSPQRLHHVQWLLVFGLPGALAILGFVVFLLRRRA
jgi:hypothetical protein